MLAAGFVGYQYFLTFWAPLSDCFPTDREVLSLDIEMRQIEKRFGPLVACDRVDLTVKGGELHCLLGENGAGKSTLVNVLYGVYKPDGGEILIDGQNVRFNGPHDAIAHGIGMVPQHFNLVPRMTATQNITMAQIPTRKNLKFVIDRKQAKNSILKLMDETGIELDPDVLVSDLAVGERQRVEILKALYLGSKLLILDEPTAVLAPHEIEELFRTVKLMADQGRSVIIITHKLAEAMKSDRVTVLKRGAVCLDCHISAVRDRQSLSEVMFDKEIKTADMASPQVVIETAGKQSEELEFKAESLCAKGGSRASTLKDLSFGVRRGEILGIAGVAGNGQIELLSTIVGQSRATSGRMFFQGKDVTDCSPKERRRMGLRFIPEDRKLLGLLLDLCVWENLVLGFEDKLPFSKAGFLNTQAIRDYGGEQIRSFNVKAKDESVIAKTLSGGNMQKVILARELSGQPRLVIAAQPTRGLDVQTTSFITEQLVEQKNSGAAVILISYDLGEIFSLSDRVAVMFHGRMKKYGRRRCLPSRRQVHDGWMG